jgi:excisionase family DNA binding protein
MDSDTLSVAETLQALRVSRATLDRWIKDGLLPVIQPFPRGERRFRRADVKALLTPKKAS